MGSGMIHLAFNGQGTKYDIEKRMDLPARACLFREDYIRPTLEQVGGFKPLLWHDLSLREVRSEAEFPSDFQTLQIVGMLERKFGVTRIGADHGYITYFNGTQRQLESVRRELRRNSLRYAHDEWAK